MNKKGTWTKEECRRKFVESEEDISLEVLAELSGFARSTLQRWSAEDPRGRWHAQRDAYRTQLSKKTEEKTIEKLSDRLSEDYAKIQKRHYNSYRVFSELATLYGTQKIQVLKRAESQGYEKMAEELAKVNPTAVNFWSLVLDRSLKGEAASLGLSFYVNQHTAIAETEKMGYLPVALPDGMTKEDLQELIDAFEADS